MTARAALAGAVRAINAAYARCPEDQRPDVYGHEWTQLEADVDAALSTGREDDAHAAIEAYRFHALDRIEEAGKR